MAIVVEILSEGTAITSGVNAIIQSIELQVQPQQQLIEVLVGTQGPAGTPGSTSNASAIASIPTGDVSAVNVQAAIAELSAEKARRSYSRTFTQSDLSIANKLAVTHGLGVYPGSVLIRDHSFEKIEPSQVTDVSFNSLSVDMTGFAPIVGTYTIVISE